MTMKLWQKIKWTLIGLVGLAFLLFLTLVIHIGVMVYHKGPLPFEHIQMARTDFLSPLDSKQIAQLKSNLGAQKGIKSIYLNTKDHNVVYSFDNRENSASSIYQNAINEMHIKAKPYTVSAKDLESGCPVMNNHSFYGKLTSVISKAIN
ncbi:hypothetical protein GCM10027566_06020 [Arachidicoccus ginsenosidivorans]|uniref:Uncharacterized protein n=1 Tax=Arachidicoccus ginsenosidivorans TaxID=496057 RepID=A0A5B8VRX4_9BACT|nr:hypothetical protein [Arachidicoccus ginsenosidivorans]QEC74023.1 hypothetical protein FSB73_22470 [Arachidicoccus ginsenosidivorans]